MARESSQFFKKELLIGVETSNEPIGDKYARKEERCSPKRNQNANMT